MNFKDTLKVYNTYIHIPFCEKKCNYCDFTSFKFSNSVSSKYVKYLLKEIELYKREYDINEVQDTIYFGGGTPSLLPIGELKKILEQFNYNENTEITIEINPKTITKDKLKEYKKLGINRLSIGIQSFNNNYLKLLGRIHNSLEAIKIFKEARELGFDNISLDLMFSLPGQNLKELEEDLDKLFSLNPEHFSIYSLIWEDGTKFYKDLMAGKLKEVENEIEAQMYEKIIEKAEQNSYIHYEISNFSKKNLNSRHNTVYWENKNYLGLGLSAAGYLGNRRYKNSTNFLEYYKQIDNIEYPLIEDENLTLEDIEQYKYLLGFRLLGKEMSIEEKDREKFENLVNQGYLNKKNNLYVMTKKGLMFFNDFVSNFI